MLMPMPLPRGTRPTGRNFPKSIFLMNSGARDYSENLAVAAEMRASVCIMENHLGDLAKCRRTGRREREIINQDQLLQNGCVFASKASGFVEIRFFSLRRFFYSKRHSRAVSLLAAQEFQIRTDKRLVKCL